MLLHFFSRLNKQKHVCYAHKWNLLRKVYREFHPTILVKELCGNSYKYFCVNNDRNYLYCKKRLYKNVHITSTFLSSN